MKKEYEEDIEEKNKEIERLRKDEDKWDQALEEKIEIIRLQMEEIEQLSKEKEWLINNWALARGHIWLPMDVQRETIVREMQQELKER